MCVIELAVLHPGRADQHGRTIVASLARERLDGGAAGGLKCRLEHQVLRRIPRDEQLGEDDEIGALRGRGFARGTHLLALPETSRGSG